MMKMKEMMMPVMALCASAVLAASCGKETPVDVRNDEAIGFAAPSVVTKTLIREASQMREGFSVFASRYVLDEASSAMTKHEVFMNNLKVYFSDGEWIYDGQPYYWSPDAYHKFFGVYPYHDASSDENDLGLVYEIDEERHALRVKGTGTDGAVHAGTEEKDGSIVNICPDIVFATVGSIYHSVGDVHDKVVFDMEHACAALTFRIRNVSGKDIRSVQSPAGGNVAISGLYDTAKLLYVSDDGPAWHDPEIGPAVNYGLSDSPAHSLMLPAIRVGGTDSWKTNETRDWFTAIVIPQDFSALEVKTSFVIEFDDSNSSTPEYDVTLSDIPVNTTTASERYTYLPGVHYIYSLEVTDTDITCDVRIVPWIEDEPIILT